MNPNDPISQKDPMGCGVACVANMAEISYISALNLFQNKSHAKTRGYYCKEIISALKKLGLNYKLKKADRFKGKIPDKTIVFVRRDKKYKFGHYLVKVEGEWIDSWINFPKNPISAGKRSRLPGRAQYLLVPCQED